MRHLYKDVIEKIAVSLLKNNVPWHSNLGMPRNVITEYEYHGINSLLLQVPVCKSPFWGTRKQWEYLGYKVKLNPINTLPWHWSTTILLYKFSFGGTIVAERQSLYNIEQVWHPVLGEATARPINLSPDYDNALLVVKNSKADIRETNLISEYHYNEDQIYLPNKDYLDKGKGGKSGYFYAAFHELAHWSEKRLGWTQRGLLAELRAEMVAGFMATEFNLPLIPFELFTNHIKYVSRWVQVMRDEPEVFLKVCAAATKATDYLLGFIGCSKKRENLLV